LGFDTRSGSRDQVLSSTVTGPDSFEYTFVLETDVLETDWLPLSTETSLNMDMWWAQDPDWPITPGDYTFNIAFVDHSEVFIRSLDVASVTAVNSSTMFADIEDSGSITFSWDLPGGSNQVYQAIIRSEDGSKEYYRSSYINDATEITASFWDLRGLEHGQTYQWFVRSMVSGYNTVNQSESLFFVYNPFDADNDGIFYLYDAFPDDDTEWLDTDSDGVGNNADPDDDNDGMPDAWELDNDLDPLVNDSGVDPDGDGLSNLDEYQSNTDPNTRIPTAMGSTMVSTTA
jgi:hypothetical protein